MSLGEFDRSIFWKEDGSPLRVGYCLTGSFCTLSRSYEVMSELVEMGLDIVPVMSENAYYIDTRFGSAEEFSNKVERLSGRKIIHTVKEAEPLGPDMPLDLLIVAPCTGNTLAKLVNGITDTAATMAMKAHLRQDRPMLLAVATNDAMSQNLSNIARALTRKSLYLVPMRQDNPEGKPYSLVSEFEMIPLAAAAALRGEQLRPLFL